MSEGDQATNPPIKLGIAYNVFDGHELLKASILSVRRLAHYICIVYQTVSNFRQPAHPRMLELINDLKSSGLVDELVLYTPCEYPPEERKQLTSKGANPKDVGSDVMVIGPQFFNEIGKRSLGREYCRRNGATHFLLMDTDEFYIHEQMEYVMKDIAKHDYDATACRMRLYFKEPTLELLPRDEINWVPMICKIDEKKPLLLAAPCPVIVDPTRRIENSTNFKSYERDVIEMHHMTFVRKDIRSKMTNVSNRGNHVEIESFIKDFEAWTPEKGILHPHSYWRSYFRGVMRTPNIFGVDFSKQCNYCFMDAKTRCSRCKSVKYCCATCQKTDWPSHKLQCKPFEQSVPQ